MTGICNKNESKLSVRSEEKKKQEKNHFFQNLSRIMRFAIKKKNQELAYLPVRGGVNNVSCTLLCRTTVLLAIGPI